MQIDVWLSEYFMHLIELLSHSSDHSEFKDFMDPGQ